MCSAAHNQTAFPRAAAASVYSYYYPPARTGTD